MRLVKPEARTLGARGLRRGIYALPSALTLGNLYFGFAAIMTQINHLGAPDFYRYSQRAALYLLGAAFFDFLDGKVARLTRTTSDFGIQLDSIADVVSFGVAPGVLAYTWALVQHHRFGWLPAFLFLVCGALRLARFNVHVGVVDKGSFEGLPIPAAAMSIVSLVLLDPRLNARGLFSYFVIVLLYTLSFLMISRIRYRSFKDFDLKLMRPIRTVLLLGVVLIVVMHDPRLMFFLLVFGFVLSGPLGRFFPSGFPLLRGAARGVLESVQEVEGLESEEEGNEGEAGE